MSKTLAWGILGTGAIAKTFAQGLMAATTGKLLAVGSRTQEDAETFGARFAALHRHGSYEALLADPDVQAVYIATPHPLHAEWALKTARAGKHILCEKPIALNHAEAMAIIEAAQEHKVFLMEAFMYRCHPQTAKVVELIRTGMLGDVRVIQASFSFNIPFHPNSRLLNNALGGGGILDVGGYCASIVRLIAGAALGKDVVEPLSVKAVGHIGEVSHVDEYTTAIMSFPNDIAAQLFAGVQVLGENVVRIFGTEGSLYIPEPWLPGRSNPVSTMVLKKNSGEEQVISVECDVPLYTLEADTVARAIESGRQQALAPAMTWEDTLGNMRALDMWRAEIGMVYDVERPENQSPPVGRRSLTVRADAPMKYGTLSGVEKRVSRLVMGVDNQITWPHTAVMLDDFFERGGNCFDTAYIYGSGTCEKMLGHWVKNRGVREQVVILDKGAHTPYCTPEYLTLQFMQSLERLQMEYVDIYMLHRDNPDIPVGEFISVLNEHKNAGRIHVFGASNWSIQRVQEANEWAAARGLTGFSALSNNFSLARMVEPVWKGCISASDPASRTWLTKTQMALMPWSSQARGFFAGRAHPDDHSDPELVRCWYSDDNFARLERVNQMARERNVQPINIALAYVLCQPFPTFPLIGPRLLSETRTSFPALSIELTPEEVRWLNEG